MAKDKKKAAAGGKAAAKAAKAAKQEKKAGKKDKKVASKTAEIDSDAEDVDLDAILAQYAKEQEQHHAITEIAAEPPSARTSCTLIASPANENEIFLFGGEYFNGATAKFFNDLMIYNIKQDAWKQVTSPNSPLPRSGHAWCRAANTKDVYLFGGEFSSPKQGTFYHYNDFWKLDPTNREWTRMEGKSKTAAPPARSGHRMVGFKQYIILFGGFQDTSATTKYLNDLWVYDCVNFSWHTPKLQAARAVPDARSSFSLLPHDQGGVIYGGYSRVKTQAGGKQQQQGGKGKKTGGGGPASRMVLKPKVHDDTWFIRVTPPAADQPSTTPPTVSWEKRKKPANAPNPPRAGATMAYHKGRGVLFGGVHDVEESEEGIDSEFFNQLFIWNIERNRYMPLTLRRPKLNANKKAAQQANVSRRDRGKAAEEELLANLKALEMKAGVDADSDDDSDKEKAKQQQEDAEDDNRPEKPKTFDFPHPRFNAALTVQADTLYIYGGTYEKGDREYTFDELWSLLLLEELADKGKSTEKSHKEVKKMAFERAEAKWWDCREEIRALEDEQEAAGIGEVVSLADKEGGGGGGGGPVVSKSCVVLRKEKKGAVSEKHSSPLSPQALLCLSNSPLLFLDHLLGLTVSISPAVNLHGIIRLLCWLRDICVRSASSWFV
ncbi:Kelch repeat [Pyrenophora seminiperda CCB06]|uniref:Kelch repeat n=1 Tax=Pyrenophora seminiperda CCB06 TaxID=1302712 RepID=A0A3M7M8C5_9PLEO|nr:Kelch repeat [Pyrenophora seminiperda CCB06]